MVLVDKSVKDSPLRKYRRNKLRLKQADIAARLNSAQAWVSQIECGQAVLQFAEDRAKVAAAYELSSKDFEFLFDATRRMFLPRKVINAVNRRDEVDVFTISKEGKGRAFPKWLNLAAGLGKDLELCPDFIYVDDPRLPKKVHSAVINGSSMIETLHEGDVVLLEEIPPDGRLPLPQIESKTDKTTLSQWRSKSTVQNDDICVVSIGDEYPTIKRVKYDVSRGELRWKLQIVADNPAEWRDGLVFQAEVGDSVVFHAKLIGRAESLKKAR